MPSPKKPSTPPLRVRMYEYVPLFTALGFLLPATGHYMRSEYYFAACLYIFAALRVGYHLQGWREVITVHAPKYDLAHLVFNGLLHLNLFISGVSYRSDKTSLAVLCVCLYRSLTMLWSFSTVWDMGARLYDISLKGYFKDSIWDVYMVCLLIMNIKLQDVSGPIGLLDFSKGVFWGACLHYVYCADPLDPMLLLMTRCQRITNGMRQCVQFAPFIRPPSAASPLARKECKDQKADTSPIGHDAID